MATAASEPGSRPRVAPGSTYSEEPTHSGWVTLSAILVLVVGVYNLIWGYAALDKKELFDPHGLIYSNLDFWGWFFIVVGALQLLSAFLLFFRRPGGLVLTTMGASLNLMMAFFALLSNSDWALVIIAFDVLILWSLLAHASDFG
jgi:hypothetical protein